MILLFEQLCRKLAAIENFLYLFSIFDLWLKAVEKLRSALNAGLDTPQRDYEASGEVTFDISLHK